jgi:hypothetical protein
LGSVSETRAPSPVFCIPPALGPEPEPPVSASWFNAPPGLEPPPDEDWSKEPRSPTHAHVVVKDKIVMLVARMGLPTRYGRAVFRVNGQSADRHRYTNPRERIAESGLAQPLEQALWSPVDVETAE